jgi:hypothetical protein
MDPRLLRTLFVLPLATCPSLPANPTFHTMVAPVATPVREWPQSSERPESEHPAHGEGSGEWPTFVGLGASGVYTNVAAQHIWFQNAISIAPPRFLDERFLKPLPSLTMRVQTHAKMSVRPTRQAVGTRSGR